MKAAQDIIIAPVITDANGIIIATNVASTVFCECALIIQQIAFITIAYAMIESNGKKSAVNFTFSITAPFIGTKLKKTTAIIDIMNKTLI